MTIAIYQNYVSKIMFAHDHNDIVDIYYFCHDNVFCSIANIANLEQRLHSSIFKIPLNNV